jgi:hypothetical protein
VNDGTGTFFAIQRVSSDDERADGVALADINGDGFLDVIISNLRFQPNRIFVNTADPLTPFGADGLGGIDFGFNLHESSQAVAVGDLDKDGDLDVVFMNDDAPNPGDNYRQQRNRVFMNRLAQGSPLTFSQSEIEVGGSNDIGLSLDGELGDMNGDGYLDLVVCNRAVGQASVVYLNNGTGSTNINPFTLPAVDFSTGASPGDAITCSSISLADADDDGDLDIFLVSSNEDFRNRVYFNDGSGTIFTPVDVGPVGQAPLVIENPSDTGAQSLAGAVGDVDNDGDIDWVIGNTISNTVSLENNLFRNTGTDGASLVRQLRAKATSLQIDNSGANSVKLSPSPSSSMVGPEFLNRIDYWVSGNAGQTWSSIMADGRHVAIGSGTDIRWRADLRSESPAMAAGLALFQLDIAENESGPALVTPIGSAEVREDDGTTGLPIVSSFTDPDGDTIYHSVIGLPDGSGLSIDPLTGEIDGVPTNEDAYDSPLTVTVFATDGALTATDTFTLTVINVNDAPVFVSTPPAGNATQDIFYSYAIFANDIDRGDTDLLAFSIVVAPAWLTLTDNANGSATLSGTPGNSDVSGDNSVTIAVTDPGGLSDTQSFVITVDNVNDAPVFVSEPPAAGAMQDTPYAYDIVTSDPDDGETTQVTISAPIKPAWLTLVDNGDGTATLSGTPTNADVTLNNDVNLVVSDPGGLIDTQNFVINVANVNDAPVFESIPQTNATQDVAYSYVISATDADFGDMDSLIVSATTMPSWLALVDQGNGIATLSGTPSANDVYIDNTVSLRVVDRFGATDVQEFVITVADTNDQPVFTSNPPADGATINVPYTYLVSARDPDAGETAMLVYSAPRLPAWLSLSDNGDGTAVLAGTPTVGDVAADNSVVLEITDPGGLSGAQSFVVNVRNTNVAPEFEGTPVTSATEMSEYRYSIRVIDPNADSVAITATTLPGWLTLDDRGNGFAILRGTPIGTDVGDHAVVIQAQEEAPAQGLITTQQFVITVFASSNGPTITVNGDAEMNVFRDWNFNDPGATATDVEDGDISDQIVSEGIVSTHSPGIYTITYAVTDSAGNRAQAQRIVRVVSPPQVGGIGSGGPAGILALLSIVFLRGFMRRANMSI